MKKTQEKKEVNGFKIESAASILEVKTEGSGRVGRQLRYPVLVKIPVGSGVFLGKGTVISKISPLIHYFNSKNQKNLHCKTIVRDGGTGVFVYRTSESVKEKNGKSQMAAA